MYFSVELHCYKIRLSSQQKLVLNNNFNFGGFMSSTIVVFCKIEIEISCGGVLTNNLIMSSGLLHLSVQLHIQQILVTKLVTIRSRVWWWCFPQLNIGYIVHQFIIRCYLSDWHILVIIIGRNIFWGM